MSGVASLLLVVLYGCGTSKPRTPTVLEQYGMDSVKELKHAPYKTQLEVIKKDPDYISIIPNPSEEMQITAVKKDPKSIMWIKNPSEKVQLEAVKTGEQSYVIYILNEQGIVPSEKVQLEAVKSNEAYGVMTKLYEKGIVPSEKVQLEAVKRNPETLNYIKNPTEKVQLAAIRKKPYVFRFIRNPTKKVQREAVKLDPFNVGQIHKSRGSIVEPDEELQLIAVRTDPVMALLEIKNPTEKVQLEAVKRKPDSIKYIKNPTEKVQLEAVKQKPDSIKYIKNPTEKVQLEAVKQKPDLIKHIKNPTLRTKVIVYGEVTVPIKKPDYALSDKSITIEVKNGQLAIVNKTNKFLKILSLAEYRGSNIFDIPPFSVPPQGVKIIQPSIGNSIKLTSLEEKILFGYAVEYKVGNGKTKSLFKTEKYSPEKIVE